MIYWNLLRLALSPVFSVTAFLWKSKNKIKTKMLHIFWNSLSWFERIRNKFCFHLTLLRRLIYRDFYRKLLSDYFRIQILELIPRTTSNLFSFRFHHMFAFIALHVPTFIRIVFYRWKNFRRNIVSDEVVFSLRWSRLLLTTHSITFSWLGKKVGLAIAICIQLSFCAF